MDPIDLTDPDLEKAATKIQATFKGYKVRQEEREKKDEKGVEAGGTSTAAVPPEEEEIDIDLNDPEVEKAATKIQATFRGYKSRREPKKEDEDN